MVSVKTFSWYRKREQSVKFLTKKLTFETNWEEHFWMKFVLFNVSFVRLEKLFMVSWFQPRYFKQKLLEKSNSSIYHRSKE